jgi:uncharacterized protein (TIGR04141 family)
MLIKRTTQYTQEVIFTTLTCLKYFRILFVFCLLLCFVSISSAIDESPEYVAYVRTVLSEKAAVYGQKQVVIKNIGVSDYVLKNFFSGKEIKPSFLATILGNFQTKYPKEHATFVSPSHADSSQTQDSKPDLSCKTEQIMDYPCLNICSLPFLLSFPETYSLIMVNSGQIPPSSIANWNQHVTFSDIGQRFLRPNIAKDENISFASTEEEAKKKKQWILLREKTIPASKKTYFIVELFKKQAETKAANLLKALTDDIITPHDGFEFQAALIIFPYTPQLAMVYGLSCWGSLLNPECIVPQWGVRVASSGQICNPNRIKSVKADHYRSSNPVSRKEKAADFRRIEAFGLEVSSEELKAVALMPNKSIKTHHVIEGTDHLQFTVNPREKVTSEQTIQSLDTIATYFYALTTAPSFHVHSRMREFVDDEIRDRNLSTALNRKIIEALKGLKVEPEAQAEGKVYLFLHDALWREMKSKKLTFGESKSRSIFDVLSQLTSEDPLPETMQVWTPKRPSPKEFNTLRMFYSLPFAYQGNFYRFDRSHWYQVDPSRFEGIKRILRKTKQHSDTMRLPLYSFEDTQRSAEQKKADYKEAKYNLRATQTIKQNPGWQAILLDRINISLEGAGSKFEFADLLIIHDNIFYIVHVKRAGASALSHHREQVERSADFLTSELNKQNAHDLLIKGIINGLYEHNGLPTTKEKGQGKRLTKGNIFLNAYASLKSKKEFISKLLEDAGKQKGLQDLAQQISRILADNKDIDFNGYPAEFVAALDALNDCLPNKKEQFTDDEVSGFLRAVKQGIQARELLFPKGHIDKDDLKRIKLVLAVIDDSAVEATLKKKKQRSNTSLFNDQDLWGLDRTRSMVEKTDLGFNIVIINESATENWDAFGAIIKKEASGQTLDTTSEEPELPHPFSVKKAPHVSIEQSPIQPTKKDLKALLKQIQIPKDDLDVSLIQKLLYTGANQILEFLTCPTVGDGDCYFHLAFTEEGETAQDVRNKAALMRIALCNAVQNGQYLDDFRPLVYEHYMGLLANNSDHPGVPTPIKNMVMEKDDYSSMYNNMHRFGIRTDGILTPENKFPIVTIQTLITSDQIIDYMERFRKVGGYESYIPIRPDIIGPADRIAINGNRRINIFTLKSGTMQLNFMRTVGTTGPIINGLLIGNHFVRLYMASADENYTHQCEQIILNHGAENGL